jgi:SAM-dependent methyltransferase
MGGGTLHGMKANPTAADWAAERGEKWSAQLAGMEATLKPVDAPLIRALELDQPYRIAEVACGGGGTSLEILRQAPAGSSVHGFDISPKLIEVAQARKPANETALEFRLANMATAAPERPYERLVSRFGVMFFDEPAAAFANLARWLAPRGRFAFAVWGHPADNSWMRSVRQVVGRIIDLPELDPQAPGPFRYANADRLLALLEGAGFGGLEVSDWRGALPVGGNLPAPEAARFALAAFSAFGEQLAQAGGDALERAQRDVAALFDQHQQDGVVRLDACVHLVTGTRS